MTNEEHDVTRLLLAWRAGDKEALNRMIPLVERELNRIARLRMRHQPPGQTLLPTALVNEAYINLIDASQIPWHDRNHFFAVATEKMHEIVIDYARRKSRVKHGGAVQKVPIDQELPMSQDPLIEVLAVHEALDGLAALDESAAKVVELRYFGGLTVKEIADVLEISERTVHNEWSFAEAWLRNKLRGNDPNAESVPN
jgi:RNA polymerase sigma factor (TIGR02999 family)